MMKNFITFLCALMLCFAMPGEIKTYDNTCFEDNWWSMLYPDMCGIDDSGDMEIKLKVTEIFERS